MSAPKDFPQVGDDLYYFAEGHPDNPTAPWAAKVVKVHEGATRVNLAVFDAVGNLRPTANVPFVNEGETPDAARHYCKFRSKVAFTSSGVEIPAEGPAVAPPDGVWEPPTPLPQSRPRDVQIG